jgi:hypothetical protein
LILASGKDTAGNLVGGGTYVKLRIGSRIGLLVGGLALTLALAGTAAGAYNAVTNGDFETGNLSGWTTFTTANGTINGGNVVSFDTSGSGTSNSAHFRAGQVVFTPGVYEGGGIYQNVVLSHATYTFFAQIAASASFGNLECGRFELLLDGSTVASHSFGECSSGQTVRSTLLGTALVTTPGSHLLSVRVSRPFVTDGTTPEQYVDNIRVVQKLTKV